MKCAPWMAMLLAWAVMMAPATADEVQLTSGEVLHGDVISRDKDNVILEHAILGRLTIPTLRVVSVTPATPLQTTPGPVPALASSPMPGPTSAPSTHPTGQPQAELSPLIPPTHSFVSDWTAKLELGFSGTQGNSDTFNGHVGFVATKETVEDHWAFDTAYFKSVSDHISTRNDYTAGIVKDWLFPDSQWLWWADGRFDYDDFKSWQRRLDGHGGLGYLFLDDENVRLVARVGAGARKEWGSDVFDVIPEGSARLDFTWKLNARQVINASTTYFQDLEEIDDYRMRNTADWTLKIDPVDGLSLKFGVIQDYESITDPGVKKSDLQYFGALVLDF